MTSLVFSNYLANFCAVAGRQRWTFGAPGERPAITGEDVVLVSEGRIVALYRLIDGPAM